MARVVGARERARVDEQEPRVVVVGNNVTRVCTEPMTRQGGHTIVHARFCDGRVAGLDALDVDVVHTFAGRETVRRRSIERLRPPPTARAGPAMMTMVQHSGWNAWRHDSRPATFLCRAWMRYHWGLGVRHFYLYLDSPLQPYLASTAFASLSAFVDAGAVTLVEWDAPYRIIGHHVAQVTALQSAVERACPFHSHVIFADVDEYLVREGAGGDLGARLRSAATAAAPLQAIDERWATVHWPRSHNASGVLGDWFSGAGGHAVRLTLAAAVDASRVKHVVNCEPFRVPAVDNRVSVGIHTSVANLPGGDGRPRWVPMRHDVRRTAGDGRPRGGLYFAHVENLDGTRRFSAPYANATEASTALLGDALAS